MRRKLYVLSQLGSWEVRWEGDRTGNTFADKDDAIRHARRVVGALPQGSCSQILVQKRDGQWQTEWTYGKDPFPPRG